MWYNVIIKQSMNQGDKMFEYNGEIYESETDAIEALMTDKPWLLDDEMSDAIAFEIAEL